jgi:hypothetical protein
VLAQNTGVAGKVPSPDNPLDKHLTKLTMMILTPGGGVRKTVQSPGERVRYGVTYRNTGMKEGTVRITDRIDPRLTDVNPLGGSYDATSRTATWEIKDVPPGKGGMVQMRVVLTDSASGVVENRASIAVGSAGYNTNAVETVVCNPPRDGWVPFRKDAKEGEPSRLVMKEATTLGLMVNVDVPGMWVRTIKTGGSVYQRLFLPAHGSTTDVGRPELPEVGQILEVPQDIAVTAELVQEESTVLKCYNVYPAQELRPEGDKIARGEPLVKVVDDDIYGKDGFYPLAVSPVEQPDWAVMRGHRLLFLKLHPVQFNPVTRELKIYSRVEVRLKYSKPAQSKKIAKRLQSPAFEAMLGNLVANYLPLDRMATEGSESDPKLRSGADYLIITDPAFHATNDPNNPADRLAEWKRRKGLITRVVDTSSIGSGTGTAADITTYLQTAYTTWDPAPTYVVLLGDAEHIVPHYKTTHPDHAGMIGTDLYFATLDGTDYFPDLFLSRLSVNTAQQASDVVDKIIAYERQPPANAAFYDNLSAVGVFQDDNGDGQEDFPWIAELETIRDFELGRGYTVDRLYVADQPAGAPAPATYEDGTNLPAALRAPNAFPATNTNDIVTAIGNGRFLLAYRDHGHRTNGWSSAFPFDKWDAAGLANGNQAPVVFSTTCQTGWFDNETDAAGEGTGVNDECFAEEFLRNANGGTVGIMASTRDSWPGYNSFLSFGYHRALWPDFVPAPHAPLPTQPPAAGPSLRHLGMVLVYGKTYMANAYGANDDRKRTFEMHHLFGDAETSVWTQQPTSLTVDHPQRVGSQGIQDFIVRVKDQPTGNPVASATVALTRPGQLESRAQTSPDGVARFTLSAPSAGDLNITVTEADHRPYEGTITVTAIGAELNRLSPSDGPVGQAIYVGGQGFDGAEQVKISFAGNLASTVNAAAGSFGQPGHDVTISVPPGAAVGLANVSASGVTSGREAIDVFQVRSANALDLFLYSQWDSGTWNLHPGDNPVWDNPDIQLYEGANPVASNNLIAGHVYRVRATIRNGTPFLANNVTVTFKWADFGAGQPDDAWNPINPLATINVPANGTQFAEVTWRPPSTGHLCIKAEIYHLEDVTPGNNAGQENCHVGPTSSPVEIPFTIWNPTKSPAMVYLELRQLSQKGQVALWGSWMKQPEPQLLRPGEKRVISVTVDPDRGGKTVSRQAEFSLTAFVGGKMVGGVEFRIQKKE